ncbi:MAG: hypothetical protein QHJ74_17690, partial [Anaerolineae bacterium]|nr:hypothetical protein [Anaerolineae bacterium]
WPIAYGRQPIAHSAWGYHTPPSTHSLRCNGLTRTGLLHKAIKLSAICHQPVGSRASSALRRAPSSAVRGLHLVFPRSLGSWPTTPDHRL